MLAYHKALCMYIVHVHIIELDHPGRQLFYQQDMQSCTVPIHDS